MEADRVRAFVAALRSGDWIQTDGRLVREEGNSDELRFCCLGVATEVAAAAGVPVVRKAKEPFKALSYFYLENGTEWEAAVVMPPPVMEWYDFYENNPELDIPPALWDLTDGRADYGSVRAVTLNDDCGFTFAQIADCFEYTFLRADWDAAHVG